MHLRSISQQVTMSFNIGECRDGERWYFMSPKKAKKKEMTIRFCRPHSIHWETFFLSPTVTENYPDTSDSAKYLINLMPLFGLPVRSGIWEMKEEPSEKRGLHRNLGNFRQKEHICSRVRNSCFHAAGDTKIPGITDRFPFPWADYGQVQLQIVIPLLRIRWVMLPQMCDNQHSDNKNLFTPNPGAYAVNTGGAHFVTRVSSSIVNLPSQSMTSLFPQRYSYEPHVLTGLQPATCSTQAQGFYLKNLIPIKSLTTDPSNLR